MKICLIAQSCHPGAGSEPGATWEYVKRLLADRTKSFTIYLLGWDGNESAISEATAGFDNVEFKYIAPPSVKLLAGGYLGQLGQFLWHVAACRAVLSDFSSYNWDIIHQISPNNSRLVNPIFMFARSVRPARLLWGPIGGFDYVPFFAMLRARYYRVAAYAGMMNLLVWVFRYLYPLTRAALRNADRVFAATGKNHAFVSRVNPRAVLLREVGIDETRPLPSPLALDPEKKNFVWAGSLIHRKNPELLLDAVAAVRPEDRRQAHFHILGGGPLAAPLKDKARALGIDDVLTFAGQVDRHVVRAYLSTARALLITSVREINTTVLMEALEVGCPVLSTEVGGVAEVIEQAGGAAVSFTGESLVARFAEAISAAIGTDALRVDLEKAYTFSSTANAGRLMDNYENCCAQAS